MNPEGKAANDNWPLGEDVADALPFLVDEGGEDPFINFAGQK